MGEVWRAKHRFLARPAAIKLIKPDVLGAMTRQQAACWCSGSARGAGRGRCSARRTPSSSTTSASPSDGTFYYVMELLDGMDLQTLVSEYGPLPPARVIYLLQQACESLAEAHDAGLVHRDIKPANIYVCRMGHVLDFVKVLDFGLVKTPQAADGAGDRAHRAEHVTGTPAYLSPESALGETVDQRTDIYALGCVAYWMLTGRYVFTGDSALQIVARHMSSVPTPPSRHSGFDVSPALDPLGARLSRERSHRTVPGPPGSYATAWASAKSRARVDAGRCENLWWETRLQPGGSGELGGLTILS